MARLSDEKIQQILDEYKKIGTYSGTAKKVGVSTSTVRKYVELKQNESKVETNGKIPKLVNYKEIEQWVTDYVMPKDLIENPYILSLDELERKEIAEIIEELKQS